jgi:hypothetical protein
MREGGSQESKLFPYPLIAERIKELGDRRGGLPGRPRTSAQGWSGGRCVSA